MDDPAVIRAALEDAGLPADRLIELMGDPEVKAKLIASTEAAVAAGVFGSPSFLVGGELFFGKDRLRDVEEEVAALAAV
jgi:2-hydroxychromene-2-carboxylate isomerase